MAADAFKNLSSIHVSISFSIVEASTTQFLFSKWKLLSLSLGNVKDVIM